MPITADPMMNPQMPTCGMASWGKKPCMHVVTCIVKQLGCMDKAWSTSSIDEGYCNPPLQ